VAFRPRTIVLAGTTGAGSATTVATAAAATTAGDTVVFIITTEDSSKTLTSVVSSTGDTCTLVGPQDYNVGANRTYIAYKIGITGSATDVWTATWSASAIATDITGFAFGGGGVAYVTKVSAGGGASASLASGSGTTSNAYAMLVGFGAVNNAPTFTPTAGYIQGSTNTHTAAQYRIADRTGSYQATMTSSISDTWACWMVEFSTTDAPDPVWAGSWGAKPAGNATSAAAAYPTGPESGNLLLYPVVSKHANLPSVSGYTQQDQKTDGSGTGADTGSVVATLLYKVAIGSESGTLAATKTTETGSGLFGQQFRLVKWGAQWSIASTTGADTSADASVSVTGAATLDIVVGDYVVVSFADVSDVGTNVWTSPLLTVPGCTFSAVELSQINNDAIGDDMRLAVYAWRCTAGSATAAPVFTATANGAAVNSHRGAGIIARVRAYTPVDDPAPRPRAWQVRGPRPAQADLVALNGVAPPTFVAVDDVRQPRPWAVSRTRPQLPDFLSPQGAAFAAPAVDDLPRPRPRAPAPRRPVQADDAVYATVAATIVYVDGPQPPSPRRPRRPPAPPPDLELVPPMAVDDVAPVRPRAPARRRAGVPDDALVPPQPATIVAALDAMAPRTRPAARWRSPAPVDVLLAQTPATIVAALDALQARAWAPPRRPGPPPLDVLAGPPLFVDLVLRGPEFRRPALYRFRQVDDLWLPVQVPPGPEPVSSDTILVAAEITVLVAADVSVLVPEDYEADVVEEDVILVPEDTEVEPS
jgi:hypothetical protein